LAPASPWICAYTDHGGLHAAKRKAISMSKGTQFPPDAGCADEQRMGAANFDEMGALATA
jgi:hypothetical protein